MAKETVELNVTLSSESRRKLERLARRTGVQRAALASLLLTRAVDDPDPESRDIVALLEGIPDAFDRARQGLEEIQAGRGIPIENL